MTPVLVAREHLAAIADLERAVFPHPWSEKALELLCTDGGFGVVLMQEGRALAYAGMQVVLDEGAITNVATHPEYRRRGLGAQLFEALFLEARRRGVRAVTLEVRVSTQPAIALYEKFGFATVGRRKRFYTAPVEDAFVMECLFRGEN